MSSDSVRFSATVFVLLDLLIFLIFFWISLDSLIITIFGYPQKVVENRLSHGRYYIVPLVGLIFQPVFADTPIFSHCGAYTHHWSGYMARGGYEVFWDDMMISLALIEREIPGPAFPQQIICHFPRGEATVFPHDRIDDLDKIIIDGFQL